MPHLSHLFASSKHPPISRTAFYIIAIAVNRRNLSFMLIFLLSCFALAEEDVKETKTKKIPQNREIIVN
jgi:hypothetical protein